jgi:hypothetical protein
MASPFLRIQVQEGSRSRGCGMRSSNFDFSPGRGALKYMLQFISKALPRILADVPLVRYLPDRAEIHARPHGKFFAEGYNEPQRIKAPRL